MKLPEQTQPVARGACGYLTSDAGKEIYLKACENAPRRGLHQGKPLQFGLVLPPTYTWRQ